MLKEKFKHKIKGVVQCSSMYSEYISNNPTTTVTKPEFVDICKIFNKEVATKILKFNYEFVMPYKLGSLRIKKFKLEPKLNKEGQLDITRLRVDWHTTWYLRYQKYPGKSRKEIMEIIRSNNEPKTLVYHYNEHTKGYTYRWYWNKQACNIVNSTVYLFKPTKANRLAIAPIIKNKDKNFDYFM